MDMTYAVRGDVGIVDSRMLGHRRRSTDILVAVLIDQRLQFLLSHLGLVEQHMVVHWTSRALDGSVGAQKEVVLKRMSDAGLNEGTWNISQRYKASLCPMITCLGAHSHSCPLCPSLGRSGRGDACHRPERQTGC